MSQSLLFYFHSREKQTGTTEQRSLTSFNDLGQPGYSGHDLVLRIKMKEYLDLEYIPSS